MTLVPAEAQRVLMRVRVEMLTHLGRSEDDTDFCGRCHLPLPAGHFESYEFCPWCCQSINGFVPGGGGGMSPVGSSNTSGTSAPRSSAVSAAVSTSSQPATLFVSARIAAPRSPSSTNS